MRVEYRTAREWILAGRRHLTTTCSDADFSPSDDINTRQYGWHCNKCDLHAFVPVAEARNLGWSRVVIHEQLMMKVRYNLLPNPTGSAFVPLLLTPYENTALLKQIDAAWPEVVRSKWERLRDG